LTFDLLAQQADVAERRTIRKVIRNNINRFFGCLALPLTLGYFFFYSFAARLHEDITQVFFMESEFRLRIEDSLTGVETIPGLWDYIEGDFVNLFFSNQDELGDQRTKVGQQGDRWGTWGRVLTYNQLSGVVRFEQSRESASKFGQPYTGQWSQQLQVLNATEEGFIPLSEAIVIDPADVKLPPCPPPCISRRLEQETPVADRHVVGEPQKRRLWPLMGPMTSSLPAKAKDEADRFSFYLYPQEPSYLQMERLQYFRNKQWLDTETNHMEILVYLLNCDLGRPRLVEISIQFAFSRGGGLFYKIGFETMMLQMFPGYYSMAADFIWFALLCVTTVVYLRSQWKSFLSSSFLDNSFNLGNIWEAFIIMAGWICVWCFYLQSQLVQDLNEKVEALRMLAWRSSEYNYLKESLAMFETAEDVSYQLGYLRYMMAQYLLFLMFRFLVSFSVQPRLATVTQTLKAVLPDLLHFLVVAIPTFVAYVISGNLIFGRRVESFATIQASLATCFRMIMENEYDWDTLAAEHYATTALWVWSFIILMNLILLNMVLAIILDVYNEVRNASLAGEMAWTTVYNYWLRLKNLQFWVPDRYLEDHLTYDNTDPFVSRGDLLNYFPDIPAEQMNLMYDACAKDIGWEAGKLLDKTTALKIGGSVKQTTDDINSRVVEMTKEDDPLQTYTSVKPVSRMQVKKRLTGEGIFLNCPVQLKADRNPHITDPKFVPVDLPGVTSESDDWLKNVNNLLKRQKKWITYINWQMMSLQWKIQQSHLRKLGGSKAQNAI